ncbi:hypothetical protein UPYG_G00340800 [Umbra pygmaea]|uniref:UPAR/Ly6 domain-containing protein n=1 Tax=Umbra pygmaea TaxID=75934 RepID=A0ABD0VWP5_UMBPY
MNKFLLGCITLVGLFVVSESLSCYTCPVGIGSFCILGPTTTCSPTQPNCFSGVATFNISNFLTIKSKGCIEKTFCNATTTSSILGASYEVRTSCCDNRDQCNGAGAIQLHLTVALVAALVAIWSTFV